MKLSSNILTLLLALGFISMFAIGIASNQVNDSQNTDSTVENSVILTTSNSDNYCCPPGWVFFNLEEFPEDPALKWDVNEDMSVCFKGPWIGSKTPKGKGNDPLYEQSNVKDNNYPCKDLP